MNIDGLLELRLFDERRWIIRTSTVWWLLMEYYNFNRAMTVDGVIELRPCDDFWWSIRTSSAVWWLSMEY